MRAQIFKSVSWFISSYAGTKSLSPVCAAAIGGGAAKDLRRTATVAVAGATLSICAALTVAHWESKAAEVAFNGRAKNITKTLQTGLNEYLSKIVALRALFEASEDGVSRAAFRVFADRLLERQPAILSVSWISRLPHSDRTAHERDAVNSGIADYRVRSIRSDGTITSAPEKDEYFPITYTSERRHPEAIYGLDLRDADMREHVLERARDNDELAASDSLVLQTGTGDRRGFFVVLPVYKPHTLNETVDQRRANLIGFVQGVFQIDLMVDTVLSGIRSPLDFVIYPSATDTSSTPLLIRSTRSAGLAGTPRVHHLTMAALHWTDQVKVADMQWRIVAVPSHSSSAFTYASSLVLLGAGLLLTAVGSAFLFSSEQQSVRLSRSHQKVLELACTDALTAVPNRRAFLERLQNVCRTGEPVSVFYIDLDHFKDVNDTLGHSTGDRLLQLVSERLRQTIREDDMVARFGGDEFAILQVGEVDAMQAGSFAAKLRETLAKPYCVGGNEITCTGTIGVTCSLRQPSEPERLMIQADTALYRAKEDGRACFRLYNEGLHEKFCERVAISDGLRRAVSQGELDLHYQPQVEIASGKLIGLEALVRWRHPQRGLIAPSIFIPIGEQTGAIIPLGYWVFEEACRQFREWLNEGIEPPTLAVNLSAVQCRHAGMEREFSDIMARYAVPPGRLEVELTESVLMDTSVQQRDVIERLKAMGLKIAIDDFGTGYSSLNYLAEYPVDRLKIAQELVFGVTNCLRHELVVKSAIRLAHELGTEVIAEGVETDAQARFLMAANCEFAQGYLFSPPLAASAVAALLRKEGSRRLPEISLTPQTAGNKLCA